MIGRFLVICLCILSQDLKAQIKPENPPAVDTSYIASEELVSDYKQLLAEHVRIKKLYLELLRNPKMNLPTTLLQDHQHLLNEYLRINNLYLDTRIKNEKLESESKEQKLEIKQLEKELALMERESTRQDVEIEKLVDKIEQDTEQKEKITPQAP
jgi:hypothetical protein